MDDIQRMRPPKLNDSKTEHYLKSTYFDIYGKGYALTDTVRTHLVNRTGLKTRQINQWFSSCKATFQNELAEYENLYRKGIISNFSDFEKTRSKENQSETGTEMGSETIASQNSNVTKGVDDRNESVSASRPRCTSVSPSPPPETQSANKPNATSYKPAISHYLKTLFFEVCGSGNKLSKFQRQEIQVRTGLTSRNITYWFANHKRRFRADLEDYRRLYLAGHVKNYADFHHWYHHSRHKSKGILGKPGGLESCSSGDEDSSQNPRAEKSESVEVDELDETDQKSTSEIDTSAIASAGGSVPGVDSYPSPKITTDFEEQHNATDMNLDDQHGQQITENDTEMTEDEVSDDNRGDATDQPDQSDTKPEATFDPETSIYLKRMLFAVYGGGGKLTKDQRRRIEKRTGLSSRHVIHWFSNHKTRCQVDLQEYQRLVREGLVRNYDEFIRWQCRQLIADD